MCICDWADGCGGTGILFCDGCGGDQCVCTCGGEMACQGCADCGDYDDADFYDSEDHWPEDIQKANESLNDKAQGSAACGASPAAKGSASKEMT